MGPGQDRVGSSRRPQCISIEATPPSRLQPSNVEHSLVVSTQPRPPFVLQMRRSSDNLLPSLPRHSTKSTILPRDVTLHSSLSQLTPDRSAASTVMCGIRLSVTLVVLFSRTL